MAVLLNEVGMVCAELRSEKIASRNRAADRLNQILSNSKIELVSQFQQSHSGISVSWAEVFNCAIGAACQHAVKITEAKDDKSITTLCNRNYIYSSIITKLIDYNIEDGNNFMSKTTMLNAFIEGFSNPGVVAYFSSAFLHILDRGLFKESCYIRELKVNEYSRILSYLFEVKVGNDEITRFAILRSIIKTIELSNKSVQIDSDLVAYFPEVMVFAKRANDERKKADVVKLLHLLMSQLIVDYHYTICVELQKILPVICGFYDTRMKPEAMNSLFKCVSLALRAIYPQIHKGNFGTFNVPLEEPWSKTIKKLKTIVDMEIQERKKSVYRINKTNDQPSDAFIEMAALITYIVHWHLDTLTNGSTSCPVSLSKIAKKEDTLEKIFILVGKQDKTFDEIWFRVMAEIIYHIEAIINNSNIKDALELIVRILRNYSNAKNLYGIRICTEIILMQEEILLSKRCITMDYCKPLWEELVTLLISDASLSKEIVTEKQLLFQTLITHSKLSFDNCINLLQSLMSSTALRRTECFETVRQMLIHADECGLEKTTPLVIDIITWAYGKNDKVDAKNLILNVAPADSALIADTCAIATTNFLNKNQRFYTAFPERTKDNQILQLLLYKYNKKLICIEEHGVEQAQKQSNEAQFCNVNKTNCLFQTSYEHLMRLLDYQITKETTCKAILQDLTPLYKLSCLLKAFLQYDIFNEQSMLQCPLIKRIGLFLGHFEFQIKNNVPRDLSRSDIHEILHQLEEILTTLTSIEMLLCYLEKQSLDELIKFVSATLKFSASQQVNNEFDDWSSVTLVCLKIFAILCASNSHVMVAFENLSKYKFNTKSDLRNFLTVLKLICSHKNVSSDITDWFVEKLKVIFRLHYTNVEIIGSIIELLPDIFSYINTFEDPLQNMLIALNSLLKIAHKSSYSTKITASLIKSVRLIVRNCGNLFEHEKFLNICISVTKFISFLSLEIQLATANTITSLMDINWIHDSRLNREVHFKFCQELFTHLDWKCLQASTTDLQQNSIAVTIQLQAALFVCSQGYQDIALWEIAYFCALRKLSEGDLSALKQIETHLQCSLVYLTRPYVTSLIHKWISKKYPIKKFPFFLCANSINEFLADNRADIEACLLIYGKPDDIKKFLKSIPHANGKIEISSVVPIVYPIYLMNQTKCPESQTSEFESHIKTLTENLAVFGVNLCNHKTYLRDIWKIIYHTSKQLNDNNHVRQLLGFSIFNENKNWSNLSHSSLKMCIQYLLSRESYKDLSDVLFSEKINSDPTGLVYLLGELKNDCCVYFPVTCLKYFYLYCANNDWLFESVANRRDTTSQKFVNFAKFFSRDFVYFVLQYLEKAKDYENQMAALYFFHQVWKKDKSFICNTMSEHLNDICRVLRKTVENSASTEVIQLSLNIIHCLIFDKDQRMTEVIAFLDDFPNTENFKELREMQHSLQSANNKKDAGEVVELFLKTETCGIEALKGLATYISKNKCELLKRQELHYILIKRFLDSVRKFDDKHFNLEASKCLGQIGPMRVVNALFYFQSDESFYEDTVSADSSSYFVRSLFEAIGKLLLEFNTKNYRVSYEVAKHVANSIHGKKLIGDFPNLSIFISKVPFESYLDNVSNIKQINWVIVLKNAESLPYHEWVQGFMSKIYEECGWTALKELSSKDINFADTSLLPFVELLLIDMEKHLPNLLSLLDHFFTQFTETQCNSIYKDKRIVNTLLKICEIVRKHNRCGKLSINLLNVAKACNYCQAYFMSILYVELWALSEMKPMSEVIARDEFQEVASKAYQSIGCNDAISGFLNPLQSRLTFLHLNNDLIDILLETNQAEMFSDPIYTSSLNRNGLFSLTKLCQTDSNIDYEVCWRLCKWDTIVEGHSKIDTLKDMEYEFQKHHFNALKCLFNREENNSLDAIAKARDCVVSILKEISVECLQSVYKYLTWLHLLQQTEEFCQVQFPSSTSANEIFEKWVTEINLPYGSFYCKDLILSHQISLFKTAGVRAERKIKDFYKENPIESCVLKCITECKNAGEINLAKRNIAYLKSMGITSEQTKANVLLEDAEICFKSGKSQITKAILEHVLKHKDFSYCLQRVRAFRMQGEYILDSNMESFETVLSKYFIGSLELLKNFDKHKDQIIQRHPNVFDLRDFDNFERTSRKLAFQSIATYADKEYTQLNTYIASDEFQMKCRITQENKQAADSIGKQTKDRDKNIGAVYMKKFANLDEKEAGILEQRCTRNLCIAIENYIKFCEIDESLSKPAIYRIVALWFANKQNSELLQKIDSNISSVPSYKFICALTQMIARLNSKNSAFLKVLKTILVRCVQHHPHQTLYQLYSLVFAFHDGAEADKHHNRVSIAKEIIAKARDSTNANCMKQMELMIPALVEFANMSVKETKKDSIELSDKIRRLKNLDSIQCPTVDLPTSPKMEYKTISVLKWEDRVSLVGGINAPKKLFCICSDGKTRPQILKGKDDLRQDAVMQQVFSFINDLLGSEPETAQRNLKLRTYKITPLSTRSGILEWCENTVPIGVYLSGDGKNGAHQKYRPDDLSVQKCRSISNQHLKSDAEKRYQIFLYICEKIKPVLHYFFLEKFLVPGVWFERRLMYTNSVATTSIVGYILGLGDRHLQNILLDERTAEVIHIDFGISFEQGKIMPTPETVPFRLTRDMVSPMGVCETNGVFKNSCNATMQILRRNHSVITAILEVLLYDPLYIWKVVPQRHHTDDNEQKNLTAQRALLSVQNKLEGKQAGILGTSDVEVQVQRLINEAQSNRNLCLLYPGWDPYL